MNIEIFDVSHGFCSLITSPAGHRLLVDCGHEPNRFYPSSYLSALRVSRLDALIVQNFDQDHVSDFPSVWNQFNPRILYVNWTVPTDWLRAIKLQRSGEVSREMEAVVAQIRAVTNFVDEPDYGGISVRTFYNPHPQYEDENNLSLLTFVTYSGFRIAYTGDLLQAGWTGLLRLDEVQQLLRTVNILVASHHGRDNGYHPDIFRYCSPQAIVISDKSIVHGTQMFDYGRLVDPGVVTTTGTTRKTLTTRNDGHITFSVSNDGSYYVTTEKG